MPFGDYPEPRENFDRNNPLAREAFSLGHPDPNKATQGELNILSLYGTMRGEALSPAEAERLLRIVEFDASFRDSA